MIKYVDDKVVFEEIPQCVTLAVTISNCPFHCNGCHSDYLREDFGEELTEVGIDMLIKKNSGINCFLFLGDGKDIDGICKLSNHIKRNYQNIKTAIYSGYDYIVQEYIEVFDYIKIGKYIEKYGPINMKSTNQRLYLVNDGKIKDITSVFWNRI